MKKRLLSIILAAIMLFSLLPATVFATEYTDTQGHWGESAIDRWSEYDIVSGKGGGVFDPDGLMTRGEAAKVFSNLFKLTEKADLSEFTDVGLGKWYDDPIAKCVNAGIMEGCGDGIMDPEGFITREMFFVMFGRALGIKPVDEAEKDISDASSMANYAKGYIKALVNKGYIQGTDSAEDGIVVEPKLNIDRASVMSLMDQTIKTYVNTTEKVTAKDGLTLIVVDNANVTFANNTKDAEVYIFGKSTAITNAPAGTVVITSEDATGTKVNGKSFSKDATKVVEKTTPSGGGSYTPPTPVTTYTVTFVLNGIEGTAPTTQTIAKDGKVTKPADPTDAVHTFAGWYKTKDTATGKLSDPWDFNNSTVTADITLYAQWARTMGSILDTNLDIPRATDNSVPANAWVNSENQNCKAYIKADSNFRIADPSAGISFTVSDEFVKVGDEYIGDWSSTYGVLTCHMTGSKFTSFDYDGENTANYKSLTGTYAPVVPVTGVSLDPNSLVLQVGETSTLEATVAPENATNKNVTWSSDKTDVATVDDAGKVTAVAAGTATITVTTVDGSRTATCTVTVTASATYTVTFDMQGHGTAIEALTNVTSDSTISAPPAPTADGYTFDGWYKETECTNAWNFDTDKITANTTLYAKWVNYLCFTAQVANSEIALQKTGNIGRDIQYRINESSWVDYEFGDMITMANVGDKVYFRGNNSAGFSQDLSNRFNFLMTGNLSASGSVMSLIDNRGLSDEIPNVYCFTMLFYNCSSLTTAPELPATTLKNHCYYSMFYNCSSLTVAPALPATDLAANCYQNMFSGCESLTTAPVLPADTLADNCYDSMFNKCKSLTTAPVLPATILAEKCYYNMLSGCVNLTTAPALPAMTLAENCYQGMFSKCVNLTTAPALPAETLAKECYYNMFSECDSLINVPEFSAKALADGCYKGMFYRCKALINAPELPVKILAENCYDNMFANCEALTTAPVLPAETLAVKCYNLMFNGCTSLSKVTMLATDISADECLNSWLVGVADTGMFYKANTMESIPNDSLNGVPSGWLLFDYNDSLQ